MLSDIGGGLRGPKTLDVVALLPEHKELEIRARITLVGGVYQVTKLSVSGVGSEAVSSEALRQIPVRTIVRVAVRPLLQRMNFDKAFDWGPGVRQNPDGAWVVPARILGEVRDLRVGPSEPSKTFALLESGHLDTRKQDRLRYTAFVYRLARLIGDAPTRAVQKEERVSRATASRRVAAAREAGYLRPDEVGQAGGA